MSALDIIPIPGYVGKYARRAIVEAWQAADSPPINSALRLYDEQKHFYDGWVARRPGYNPADNPDDETQQLAHVRGVALDIDPTPERVRRLTAAGLHRPFSYEPWHWVLPNVRSYPIVRELPAAAAGSAGTQEGIIMAEAIVSAPNGIVVHLRTGGKTNFTKPAEYNTFRDQVAFLRERGATDLMPLPPLEKVPRVTWDTFTFLCAYIGAPTK